jgi:short-subunit dehydrogenase involved in D-alanine esterification of teichoic acids
MQVVATDVNADNLASLVNEAPDIRAEVMDVKKSEDVEIVIPGVQHHWIQLNVHDGCAPGRLAITSVSMAMQAE